MLKKLGVPIWRWDDMAASDCAISQRYREHLLHLPCHQALSDAELQWMLQAVSKVMRCGPVPAAIAAA
jgi:dTDP-4-amino-4,6-dideoxygalactose transaminase